MTAGLAKAGDTSSLTCTQAPADKEIEQSKKKREKTLTRQCRVIKAFFNNTETGFSTYVYTFITSGVLA